jgi:penicillin-binding protein A
MAIGGFSIIAPQWAAYAEKLEKPWSEPIWVMSLASENILGPSNTPVPAGMPGSLMKLVAATAILQEKLMLPDDALECRGTLHIQGQTFHCEHAHGKIAMREAIGLSCNLFFAQAAQRLSAQRFLQYARLFQLHEPLRLGDAVVFPNRIEKGLPSQSYVLGLNRNMRPSALQLVRMAGLIARRDIPGLRPHTWEMLQAGMQLAVKRGTASGLDPDNRLHMAAKTGTTQHGHAFQSWLIGFFPIENPQYAFCVRSPFGTAKGNAVPLARRFFATHIRV